MKQVQVRKAVIAAAGFGTPVGCGAAAGTPAVVQRICGAAAVGVVAGLSGRPRSSRTPGSPRPAAGYRWTILSAIRKASSSGITVCSGMTINEARSAPEMVA